MLRDAYDMDGTGPSEELLEVEEELIKKKEENHIEDDEENKHSSLSSSPVVAIAMNSSLDDPETNTNIHNTNTKTKMISVIPTYINVHVFTQAFTLTFLAEWGDRSQIATIGK